jgi:hypothetical protein
MDVGVLKGAIMQKSLQAVGPEDFVVINTSLCCGDTFVAFGRNEDK